MLRRNPLLWDAASHINRVVVDKFSTDVSAPLGSNYARVPDVKKSGQTYLINDTGATGAKIQAGRLQGVGKAVGFDPYATVTGLTKKVGSATKSRLRQVEVGTAGSKDYSPRLGQGENARSLTQQHAILFSGISYTTTRFAAIDKSTTTIGLLKSFGITDGIFREFVIIDDGVYHYYFIDRELQYVSDRTETATIQAGIDSVSTDRDVLDANNFIYGVVPIIPLKAMRTLNLSGNLTDAQVFNTPDANSGFIMRFTVGALPSAGSQDVLKIHNVDANNYHVITLDNVGSLAYYSCVAGARTLQTNVGAFSAGDKAVIMRKGTEVALQKLGATDASSAIALTTPANSVVSGVIPTRVNGVQLSNLLVWRMYPTYEVRQILASL